MDPKSSTEANEEKPSSVQPEISIEEFMRLKYQSPEKLERFIAQLKEEIQRKLDEKNTS